MEELGPIVGLVVVIGGLVMAVLWIAIPFILMSINNKLIRIDRHLYQIYSNQCQGAQAGAPPAAGADPGQGED